MRLPSPKLTSAACALGVLGVAACVGVSGLAGGAGDGQDAGDDTAAAQGIALKPAALDFGPAGCGTQPPAQSVTLENLSGAKISYEASLPEASGFALGGQRVTKVSGDILPGGLTVLTIDVASLRTLGPLATKLTVKFDGQLREIPISVKGLGATIATDPKIVDFGDVYYQASASSDVVVRNAGTEAVTIASFKNLAADFALEPGVLPLTVPAGGSATVKVKLTSGAASAPLLDDISLVTAAGPFCGEPATLSLRGHRVDADLTVNPGTVDFGPQGCGTNPLPKQLTISNYAPVPIDVVPATLPATSRYVLAPGLKRTIPAGSGTAPGTLVINLNPKPVALPLGSANEVIAFDFGTPKGIKSATAHIDVRGVVLSITPPILDFNAGTTKSFTVQNQGNVTAVTRYTVSDPANWNVVSGDTVFAGTSSNMVVLYAPQDPTASYMATITTTLTSGGPLCVPAQPVMVRTK